MQYLQGNRIFREREKTGNFTIILNELLQRTDVSMQAKGLYAYIMTLPDDWILYTSELVHHFTNGRESVMKAFNELRDLGYIEAHRVRMNGKFAGWEYIVYESTENGFPASGKP